MTSSRQPTDLAELDTDPRTAIALDYDRASGQAPRVTAKGEGAVAERIIELAHENGVPVEENPLLAIALADVELDDKIPPELYQAVSEVISFVLRRAGELDTA